MIAMNESLNVSIQDSENLSAQSSIKSAAFPEPFMMITGRFCCRASAMCDIVPISPSHTIIAIGTGIPWKNNFNFFLHHRYGTTYRNVKPFQLKVKVKVRIYKCKIATFCYDELTKSASLTKKRNFLFRNKLFKL